MAAGKEIRNKIKSVENTKKITKAMEMVAASKMRKAQDRMRSARPYSERIRVIASHLSQANSEYVHPFLEKKEDYKKVGLVVISTDKGLCGGLNTNLFRQVLNKVKETESEGKELKAVAIGNKALGFLTRIGIDIVSSSIHLGDSPRLEDFIGSMKEFLDLFNDGELGRIYLCSTKFINTMKQDPKIDLLLPLTSQGFDVPNKYAWDYLYEPDSKIVIEELLKRYVESIIYQAVVENIASEQSARMVAMKSATDNAGNVIDELKLVYNKTRQAGITKELSEIVAGAAAV
ncbi:MAG: F0F1 ATP synthase subunit gamma [Betaproteobacteria bacterium TMED41]|mgnify:CR=1 FL=1|nr:MAG: F0F1 ATP synthase subunit gamma [Betaproteobacteria bacterium TMED41]